MLNPVELAVLAAGVRFVKSAIARQHGRSGRTSKGTAMARELKAAGTPGRQNHGTTFSYPRGKSLR